MSFVDNLSDSDFEKLVEIYKNAERARLNKKEHIKKYNMVRNIHGEILSNMLDYLFKEYGLEDKLQKITEEYQKKNMKLDLFLDSTDDDDLTIMMELFIYKNYETIKPITEIYLEENKFKARNKVRFLEAMGNSYAGLFKIIGTDSENGYITLEDVFTHKVFKVIDISMSTTFQVNKKRPIYMYNRIIDYDDISFLTGIHCVMDESKELNNFIENHKYDEESGFFRCLTLYNISKKCKKIKAKYNYDYNC